MDFHPQYKGSFSLSDSPFAHASRAMAEGPRGSRLEGRRSVRRPGSATAELGETWLETTPSAPWVARQCNTSLAFDGKIWVLGGGRLAAAELPVVFPRRPHRWADRAYGAYRLCAAHLLGNHLVCRGKSPRQRRVRPCRADRPALIWRTVRTSVRGSQAALSASLSAEPSFHAGPQALQ